MEKGFSFLSLFVIINAVFSKATSRSRLEQGLTSNKIESDLQTRDLTQRMANFETEFTKQITTFEMKYIERITALETKLDNNPLQIIAEMMKVVLQIQSQTEICKTSLSDLKVLIEDDKIKTNTSLLEMGNEINEIKRVSQEHEDTIQNVSHMLQRNEHGKIKKNSNFLEMNNEVNAIKTVFREHNDTIEDISHVLQRHEHDKIKTNTSLLEMKNDIRELSRVSRRLEDTIQNVSVRLQRHEQDFNMILVNYSGMLANLSFKVTENYMKTDKAVQSLTTDHAIDNRVIWSKIESLNQEHTLQNQRVFSEITAEIRNVYTNVTAKLNDRITTIQNQMGGLRTHTAFCARMTTRRFVGNSNRIVYNDVLLNEGSAYNPSTGLFTCRVDGFYVFSWVTEITGKKATNSNLYLNSEKRLYVFPDAKSGSFNDATGVEVIKLRRNDQVHIGVGSTSGIHQHETNFCGWNL